MIKSKKFTAVTALALAGGLALTSCTATPESPSPGEDVETVKIAVPIELTGPVSVFGIAQANAIQLAVDKINERGGISSLGGAHLELLIEDSRSDAERSVQLLREMKADGAVVAIGPSGSGAVLAAKPILESLELPWVGLGLDDRITEENESQTMWRPVQGISSWADDAMDFFEEQVDAGAVDVQKAAVVTMTIAPGPQVRDIAVERLNSLGVETTVFEYDPAETRDFSNLVASLRDGDYDLVTGLSYPNDGILFAEALTLQDWRPSEGFLWVAGAHYLNGFRTALGDRTEGWLAASYASPQSTCAPAQAVADEYAEQFGEPMTGIAVAAPSVVEIIAQALEKAASTEPDAIKAALASLEIESCTGLYSLAGGLKFNENGDNSKFVATIIQHDGAIDQVGVWPESVATREVVWPALTPSER